MGTTYDLESLTLLLAMDRIDRSITAAELVLLSWRDENTAVIKPE